MEDQFVLSEKDFQKEKRKKVAKPLLWFGMVSIVMLFAGLTSAVIVRKGDGDWLHYELPSMFLWSSIVIVLSSICLILAGSFAKKDKVSNVKWFVAAALAMGLGFVFTQFQGYQQLIEQEVFFTGANHNASGSFLYIISGLHLAHLAGGLIAMIVVFFNAFKDRYDSKKFIRFAAVFYILAFFGWDVDLFVLFF